ncbi:MAG: helix-turn-helix domain-containing protein [Chloroflexota bacterium]
MKIKLDSDKIRLWRKERGWSQEQVAEKAGISLRTIQRIENSGTASSDSAASVADAFGTKITDFMIDEEAQGEKEAADKLSQGLAGLKMSFGIHLISFLFVIPIMLVIDYIDNPQVWFFLVPTAFWAVGLIAHGGTLLMVAFISRMNKETKLSS